MKTNSSIKWRAYFNVCLNYTIQWLLRAIKNTSLYKPQVVDVRLFSLPDLIPLRYPWTWFRLIIAFRISWEKVGFFHSSLIVAFWNSMAAIFSHLTGRSKYKLQFCVRETALRLNSLIWRVSHNDLTCLEMLQACGVWMPFPLRRNVVCSHSISFPPELSSIFHWLQRRICKVFCPWLKDKRHSSV